MDDLHLITGFELGTAVGIPCDHRRIQLHHHSSGAELQLLQHLGDTDARLEFFVLAVNIDDHESLPTWILSIYDARIQTVGNV